MKAWLAKRRILVAMLALTLTVTLSSTTVSAQDEEFSTDFDRERCTFTSAGTNPYFPLWPGYALKLEGEEEDAGETIEIEAIITILSQTKLVDGVLTRVVEERESEDGELVEVSRNFMALCRETGDVWYFGEEVDDYEDGQIVGHGGAWLAGVNGAQPGIIMLGNPVIGARYYQEIAPGVAEDRGEVVGFEDEATVPAGTFERILNIVDTSGLDPGSEGDEKLYAHGVGNIVDEVLELTEITPPPCQPDETTHCLNNGRFRVEAEWGDFEGGEGSAGAILPSDDSGEFWFFSPNNTELLVKVINACNPAVGNRYWVFAAGLTNVEVTLTVTDTKTAQVNVYSNDLGSDFEPVLDTAAFATCP